MRLRYVAGCSNAGHARVTEPDRRPASGARTEDAATLAPRWASQRAPPLQRKRTTSGRRSRLAIGPWRPTRPFPARDYVREHDAHRTPIVGLMFAIVRHLSVRTLWPSR
jgi:hypothetical protein